MLYDEFKKDPNWQYVNEQLHKPGLTYKERDALRGQLDVIEDRIRKEQKKQYIAAVQRYTEDLQNYHDKPLTGEFYD